MKKKWISVVACCLAGVMPGCAETKPPENTFDPTALPFYVSDVDSLSYSYTEEERIRPYWQGNVIYNEQLMVVEQDGVTEGRLLYPALRVISVRDWSLETEYVEGQDYIIEGDRLTLPEGSAIPVFRDEWSRGVNVPEEYPPTGAGTGYQMFGDIIYTETGLIYRNYIHVTYVYDPAQADRTKVTEFHDDLYGFRDLLKTKEEIKMVVFGDSISEGCSSSGKWNHAPFCPPYADLVKFGIETYGGVKVDLTNLSVGGKDSSWGAEDEQLDQIMRQAPDLLVIGFGTNDSAGNIGGSRYRRNITAIIEAARIANANCQIVLLAPFPSNEAAKSASLHEEICTTLRAIAADEAYLDVTCVSLYESCLEMLQKKHYYEIAGNNVNHPNDFITRCYAMNILSALFDFTEIK